MPTENPKISAYVPQIIYDRFKQFQEERSLSMSQAAIELFAEYFGIDLSAPQRSTGSLLSRLNTLETDLAGLKEAYVLLAQRVDSIQSISELLNPTFVHSKPESRLLSELTNKDVLEPSESFIKSESLDGLPDELQEKDSSKTIIDSEPTGGLLEKPLQLPLIEEGENCVSKLLSELRGGSLTATLLSIRLGVHQNSFSRHKNQSSPEDFLSWIQDKDPDRVKWEIIGEGRTQAYIPTEDTSLEALKALKNWIRANTLGPGK